MYAYSRKVAAIVEWSWNDIPPYMQFSVCKCKFVQTKRETSLGDVLYISLLPLIVELSRAGPIVAGGRVS